MKLYKYSRRETTLMGLAVATAQSDTPHRPCDIRAALKQVEYDGYASFSDKVIFASLDLLESDGLVSITKVAEGDMWALTESGRRRAIELSRKCESRRI